MQVDISIEGHFEKSNRRGRSVTDVCVSCSMYATRSALISSIPASIFFCVSQRMRRAVPSSVPP